MCKYKNIEIQRLLHYKRQVKITCQVIYTDISFYLLYLLVCDEVPIYLETQFFYNLGYQEISILPSIQRSLKLLSLNTNLTATYLFISWRAFFLQFGIKKHKHRRNKY